MKRFFRLLFYLSLCGALLTAYLIYQHYKPAGSSYCNVNTYINCDIVNKSTYSEILGIPVSVLGFLTYVFFFIISAGALKGKKIKPRVLPLVTAFSGIAAVFSLYLTYVEFFVLRAVCLLCLSQQLILLLVFLTFLSLWLRTQKPRSLFSASGSGLPVVPILSETNTFLSHSVFLIKMS